MLRILTLALILLGMSTQGEAQRWRDARSYYRNFESENRRIKMKNVRYLESVIRGDDPRKVDKYREMVLEQLKDSKRSLERVGDYQGDDVLHREYLLALDMYIEAFEKNFSESDSLIAKQHDSYEDLLAYYEAQNQAEMQMIDAAYKIEETENYFAKTYDVDLRRDEETDRKLEKLDMLAVYIRSLTKAFFRVDAEIRHFTEAAEKKGEKDSLNIHITNIRKALKKSQEDVKNLESFDGKDWLEDELIGYLEDVNDAIDSKLRPLADNLSNEFLDEDEYRETQGQLEDFKEWHEEHIEDFYETKREVVERYLEE